MKSFHRVVLYLVSLVLVLLMISAGSGAVLAAEELSPIFETNPLYPQYVPAETAPILNSAEDTAVQAVSTLDEAVVVLREGLENRTASVRIALPDGHTPAEEDAYYVWNNALEETGVPTQGDYIRWHWSGWGCAWDYEWTGSFYRYFMTFTVSYYTTSAQETELTAEVNKIIDSFGFTSSTSDYDKVKTIHAWVTDNITYDYTSSGSMKQTAYNGIMEGTCVCQGYSSIMYRMLWQVGVPARIIPGDTNATPAPSKDDVDDNHGWNIVKLGEKWYNLDATWDAGVDEENWDYFLTCPDSFTGHYRWPDYDTADFHSDYPMADANYAVIASGTCGENLTWTLDSVGVLVISGEGAIDYHCITWWDYLGEITSVVINDGVTSVGNSVFQDCNNLVSISLPNSITYIGSHAFNGCASLASVVIPNGITRIEQDTFAYCEKLISIAIPNTVTYIDNRAFLNCSSLSEIDIPDDVDYIGDWAFFGCSNLETITLPEGINRIGESSFTYCGKLSNITIPESISVIDDWAFGGCCNFTKINIPASVTHISNYAFYQCNSLTSIAFYGDVPSFGCYVFGDVTATAYYPAGNATWTEDVLQDYGGDITWVAYSDEPEIVKFDFSGSTMTLGNELVLNFVYNKALLTGTDNYAQVTIAREDGDYTYEIPQSEWTAFNAALNQIPVKVFAKEMTDEVTVVICNAAGQEVSNPRTGSVVAYCNNLFEKSTVQKDKAMAVDMLNYGAAAQIQFNYREETLANAGLTDELKALATVVTDMEDTSSKGPGCAGNTLTLEDKILLNFVYQNATIDKAAYATVSYVDHYDQAVSYNIEAADFLTFNSSMKMVQINTLVVADCRTMVSVELFDADGNSLGVSKNSVESYTARSGQELFKAILAFGDSAYAKFH